MSAAQVMLVMTPCHDMVYGLLTPVPPMDRLPVVGKDLRQRCSPATASQYTEGHILLSSS